MNKLDAIVKKANDWDESQHPRDREGKFSETAEQGGALVERKERTWTGKPRPTVKGLGKLETGEIGESVAVRFLQSIKGLKDAAPLHVETANHFPLDLVGDHEVFEVKTGIVSSSMNAWRVTLGQPGKTEAAWLRKASPEAKRKWNQQKYDAAMKRKQQVVKEFSLKYGRKLNGRTIGVIVDPDKCSADVYMFDGFHAFIGWNGELAKKSYVGSYGYGSGTSGGCS